MPNSVASQTLFLYSTTVSDVGTVRSNNQDSAFAGEHLIAICDGMGGHAGGDADHVLLGNAAVKVTIRVLLAEDFGFGGSGQVGVKNHQIISALLGQLYQCVAVADTGSNFFNISHC